MCLLVFAWQVVPDHPLVVAANRDERLDRPAEPFGILREGEPKVLGGRDVMAGGTWLAANDHGVVAGLTNRPSPGGRDPAKRSRGELPLLACDERTAEAGVAKLERRVRTGQYNPAWLLIGDRQQLFYVELPLDRAPRTRVLSPGTYVLENAPLDSPSWKVDRVRSLLDAQTSTEASLWHALPSVLADHLVPSVEELGPFADDAVNRRPATLASCVHTDDYGTRSATLIRIPARRGSFPELGVSDGPSCTTPFVDATHLWESQLAVHN